MGEDGNYKHQSIPNWSDEDRPREKLLSLGVSYISDVELLAIILGSGSKDKSAVDLARNILSSVGHKLATLKEKEISDLLQFHGVGPAKAVAVKAAFEIGRRAQMEEVDKKPIVNSSQIAYQLLTRDLGFQKHEECWVLYLNRQNMLISKERMSSGGITGTVVDIRLILKKAVEKLATGIILSHNHPSGNLKPSQSDRVLTKKLLEACKYLDLQLLDHLILTANGYFSFADEGELQ